MTASSSGSFPFYLKRSCAVSCEFHLRRRLRVRLPYSEKSVCLFSFLKMMLWFYFIFKNEGAFFFLFLGKSVRFSRLEATEAFWDVASGFLKAIKTKHRFPSFNEDGVP